MTTEKMTIHKSAVICDSAQIAQDVETVRKLARLS